MESHNNRCISLVHHHLEPGGVTEVIELSVRALIAYLPGVQEIRLVTGRSGGAEKLLERLTSEGAQKGVTISLKIIGNIDYLPVDFLPGTDNESLTEVIKRELLDACSGSVWLVHNYHLGKNPLFTRALLEIARDYSDERICFYIHDFPECSRYENLAFSRRFRIPSIYPVLPNVRYIVINGRDLKYMIEAGIPKSHVFLLNNPVPAGNLPEGNRNAKKKKFEEKLFLKYSGYTRGAPLFLYPIRTIRRKNVLETGLVCAVAREEMNLVVTLPGTSETEKEYSSRVGGAFSDGLIPGIWGIGSALPRAGFSFFDLVSIADVICSSSVQEGFGYLFVNSVNWGIPLFARYLDVLDGITSVFDNHPSHFYRSMRVPLEPGEIRKLKAEYVKKAKRIGSLIGESIENGIIEEFSSITDNDSVDYSYFSLGKQLDVLERVKKDAAYKEAIRKRNIDLFDAMSSLCDGNTAKNEPAGRATAPAHWPFTFETYAGTVSGIIDSFASTGEASCTGDPGVHANLLRRFASIKYLRLLYAN